MEYSEYFSEWKWNILIISYNENVMFHIVHGIKKYDVLNISYNKSVMFWILKWKCNVQNPVVKVFFLNSSGNDNVLLWMFGIQWKCSESWKCNAITCNFIMKMLCGESFNGNVKFLIYIVVKMKTLFLSWKCNVEDSSVNGNQRQ